MQIIEDSRQHKGKHEGKNAWFAEHAVTVHRSKLAAGDYALPPECAVDTKRDIFELAQDIDQEHARFKSELVLAQKMGTLLVILTENEDGVDDLDGLADWEEPMAHFQMRKAKSKNPRSRRISGERLAKACRTMERRYGCRFEFCAPEEAAGRLLNTLVKEAHRSGRHGYDAER